MNVNGRKLHPAIRKMCKKKGWKVWSTYNDKHAGGSRRIAYARNGWEVPKKMKEKILKGTKRILKEQGIEGRPYWFQSERSGYGAYDKLCIYVPA